MEVKIDGEIIAQLNIYAKNDIRKKEVFDYFKELFLDNLLHFWYHNKALFN